MTIFLTGATGFVGRVLVPRFQRDGRHMRALVRAPSSVLLGVEQVQGDLEVTRNWSTALEGCEAVIHLAARVHVMHEEARDPLAAYRAVNRNATLVLARAASVAGVKRFIYISSIKVNGERTNGRPFTAADRPHPADPYGISKWEAEEGLRALAREARLEVVVIRPPLVHGPGAGGNLRRLLALIDRGVPLPFGSIRNRRAMVGVDNLADLIATAVTHPAAAGATLLASDEENVSTPELVRLLAVGLGVQPRIFPFPTTLLRAGARMAGLGGEIDRLVGSLEVDITATRAALGWVPPVSLADGLAEMARAWKAGR